MTNDRLIAIFGATAGTITIFIVIGVCTLAHKHRIQRYSADVSSFDLDDQLPNSRLISSHAIMRSPRLVAPIPPNVHYSGSGSVCRGFWEGGHCLHERDRREAIDQIFDRTEETGVYGGLNRTNETRDMLPRYQTPPPSYHSSEDGDAFEGDSTTVTERR